MQFPSLHALNAQPFTIRSGDAVYTAVPAAETKPLVLRLAIGSNNLDSLPAKVVPTTILFRMLAVFAVRDYDKKVFTLLLSDYPMIASLMKGLV